MKTRDRFSLFIACIAFASLATAGAPRLNKLVPQGAQRGTTVDVEFQGHLMTDVQEVMAYTPGIQVVSMEPIVETQVNGKPQPVTAGTRLKVKLAINPDCAIGHIGLRLRTVGGLSDYQRFFVSPFPVILEDESSQVRNDELNQAKAIEPNQTIVGSLRESADIDLYRLEAKAGQRLSAEIVSARLGIERGLPDLHVSILKEDGEMLVAADDSALFLQDPAVSITAPADGAYLIAVRHALYSANGETYLLHAGNFVRPTAIYPAGGKAGTVIQAKLLGDPLGTSTADVALPSEFISGLERRTVTSNDLGFDFDWCATDAASQMLSPTPNLLRVVGYDNVLEAEPNNAVAETQSQTAVDLPIAFNGILEKAGDVDLFRFKAKKGDKVRIRALANAFGSPVDPMIWIQKGDGTGSVTRANDSRTNHYGLPPINGVERNTLDAVLIWTAPADGEFVLGVEDERSTGGADHVYRVECQLDQPAVFTYIPPEADNRFTPQARQAVNVPAGGRYNTTLSVISTDKPYEGELELVALGLPEGVTMHAPHIRPDMTRVPVFFSATPGTAPQGAFIDIVAKPVREEGKEPTQLISGVRQNLPMNLSGNQDYYLHVHLDKVALAVTQESGFELEVEAPKSALVQNGEMAFKFKIHRREGFDEPVTIMMEWKPNGVTTATPLNLAEDVSEGEYLISAARNAAAGKYLVTLTAVNGKYQPRYGDSANRAFICSVPFELTIAEPHFDAKFPRASVERGKTSDITVKLNPLKPLAGRAKVALARLPRGVQTVEPFCEINPGETEVKFTLQAGEEALVGSYKGITLDVTVEEQGQVVRQFTGSGTLRVDSPRGIQAQR